jgi:hypothetical protein
MKRLDLIRTAYFPFGTFGKFLCGSDWLATVERPWLNNASKISCIPEGSYTCVPRFFNKDGYNAIEILNVPNRENILFHIANWPNDVEGCIGVGKTISCLTRVTGSSELAVLNSTEAFKVFMGYYGEGFELYIRQTTGAVLFTNGSKINGS